MGFEAPLALLALAAAGLPLLAHLLRRRDLPKRKLPTIALLRRAEASSRKNVRLVDMLLLAVRILLVALAAIALAGPFARVTLAYGDGSTASVALIIDDSLSMAGRGDPSLLSTAIGRARDIVEALPPGSEVTVVLAGASPRTLLARTDDRDAALLALAAIPRRSARGTDLPGAFERAERELAGARHAERRIVVLSDLAAHGRLDAVRAPLGMAVSYERIGADAPTANAAIAEVRATPDPTTPGQSSVAVSIRASRDLDGRRATVALVRGGQELARAPIAIEAGAARTILHASVSPEDPAVEAVLELDDAIALDNRRGVLLRSPAGARVLLVDGDARAMRGADEVRFVARAIDLAPSNEGALSRRIVDPDTFETMDLADAEVIVLANVPTVSAPMATRLREHVEAGGGLLIAPGDHFDARAVEARLRDLLPARVRPAVAATVGGPIPSPDSQLLPAGASGLEGSATRRRLTFEDPAPDAEVALRFEDDTPALLIGRHGAGRVAILATTLDDDWTDLPYRPGFLPLIVRLLRHLAPGSSTSDEPIHAGAPVHLRPPVSASHLRVVTPIGVVIDLEGDALTEEISIDDTEEPGVYRAQVATRGRALHEEPRMAFVVAPPTEESDLSPGPEPEASDGGGATSSAGGTVVERPFARWLFLLVGLLAIFEAVLRHRVSSARAS